MRILIAFVQIILAGLLTACDRQDAASAIDPALGLECYESLRATLPPGTQYEGIEKMTADRLVIRIMNGVAVVTLDCSLNPDRTLDNTGK